MDVVAHAHEWGGGPGPWIGLVWFAVIAIIAAVVITVTRRNSRRAAPESGPTTAAESVLAERYARGEITDDEYLAKISVLRDRDA